MNVMKTIKRIFKKILDNYIEGCNELYGRMYQ